MNGKYVFGTEPKHFHKFWKGVRDMGYDGMGKDGKYVNKLRVKQTGEAVHWPPIILLDLTNRLESLK